MFIRMQIQLCITYQIVYLLPVNKYSIYHSIQYTQSYQLCSSAQCCIPIQQIIAQSPVVIDFQIVCPTKNKILMFKIRFIPLKIAVRPHIDVYQLHRDYSEIPDQYPSVRCNQEDRSQIFKQTILIQV
jgi:hypothetical protein